jgi:hypothetical protein
MDRTLGCYGPPPPSRSCCTPEARHISSLRGESRRSTGKPPSVDKVRNGFYGRPSRNERAILMKAFQVRSPGGPDKLLLTELPDPQPGPGEAVIDVAFAGCNWGDTRIRGGTYSFPVTIRSFPLRSRRSGCRCRRSCDACQSGRSCSGSG